MKRRKSATFAKNNSNKNTLKMKFIINLKIIFNIMINTEVMDLAQMIQNLENLNPNLGEIFKG